MFAVAVHVFTLLMNGCHPFACAKDVNGRFENTMEQTTGNTRDSVVAPQPIENIKDGFFPFAKHKVGIRTPIYAPEFSSLPDSLRALFIRTFLDGYHDPAKRVGTEEWIQELDRVKNEIVPCSNNPVHYYFRHNVKCSLCAVEEAFMSYMSDENKHSRANDSENKESVNNVTYINNSSGGSGNVNARGNTKSTALKKRKSKELLLAGILLIISGMWMFFEEAMNLDDFGFSSNVDDLIGLWCLTGWCLLFGSGIIMLTTYLTVKSSSMTANDFNMSETNRIYGVLFIVFGLGEAYNIYYLYIL